MKNRKIIIISGPTASGKTLLAVELAKKYNGIVVNADSIQVYKGLPTLSAQPMGDEKGDIEHRLFSYFEPNKNCNVGLWLELAKKEIDSILESGRQPIVVGGTGMYISKLMDGINKIPETTPEIREEVCNFYNEVGYDEFRKKCMSIDPEHTNKINPNDKQRLMRIYEIYRLTGKTLKYFQTQENIKFYPKNMFFHINLNPEKPILYEKCNERFKLMVEKFNVIDEIKNFINNNRDVISNPKKYSVTNTIGLREGIKYLNCELNMDEFIEKSTQTTRNYAKRQMTWFNHQFDKFDYRIGETSKESFLRAVNEVNIYNY